MIKICKDCIYFVEDKSNLNKSRCNRTLNLVTGDPKKHCSDARKRSIFGCSIRGKYWKEKIKCGK